MSLSQLITELKKVPYGCQQHRKLWGMISDKIAEKYPNQYVLCTRNELGSQFHKDVEYRLPSNGLTVGDDLMAVFPENHSFPSDLDFAFMPRENVEYNFSWKQLNVFGFVTDGTKYALLQKVTNSSITMIGGHVDYDALAYNVSQRQWLSHSLQKEVDEEIAHRKTLVVPDEPIALLNTTNEFHDLFHAAAVYKIEIDDVDAWFPEIVSGEPEKHNVVKFDSKEELLSHKKVHHWLNDISGLL